MACREDIHLCQSRGRTEKKEGLSPFVPSERKKERDPFFTSKLRYRERKTTLCFCFSSRSVYLSLYLAPLYIEGALKRRAVISRNTFSQSPSQLSGEAPL